MEKAKKKASFGTWASPVKASSIASATLKLGQVLVDQGSVYWLEGRPKESGRAALMRQRADGKTEDLLPAPLSARSLVHEYGGAAFVASGGGEVFFTNYADQRIYKLVDGGKEPLAVSQDGPYRYADMVVDRERKRIYCVVEEHDPASSEPLNYIGSISIDGLGSSDFEPSIPEKLVSSSDFYAYPRISTDGRHLAWISWNHPNMPWDGTVLTVASFNEDGSLGQSASVAGSEEESIFQPAWSPDNKLHFVSDKSGFWNIYRLESSPQKLRQGVIELKNLTALDCEFGMPLWVFNMSTYAFLDSGEIVAIASDRGIWKLYVLKEEVLEPIETEYTDMAYVFSDGKTIAMLASSPDKASAVVRFEPASRQFTTVKNCASFCVEEGYVSYPETIEFPTSGGKVAYAFYYPPTNKDFDGLDGELPPLLVKSHGGPTGATSTGLDLSFQYWTSRGFAVVDVNYGGSTGYGREYMKRLEKNWGIVDVDDCEHAALHLVSKGKVDGSRLAITGGSAGGYTTLCVLTFKDSFSAGASHYGIGDLELLAKDTHKFESRYTDRLVGPYPEAKQVYIERSPLHYTDKLSCPLIVFQGLEDKVVPANQAEAMVEAVKAKQLPVAYIAYEGEQHGFRKAENIERTIEAEFYFFSRIFGFEPNDKIEPVEIANFKSKEEMARSRS